MPRFLVDTVTGALGLLRLDRRQAIDLIASPLTIAVIAAWIAGERFATDSISGFLSFLGVPAEVAIHGIHGWFVAPSRSSVLQLSFLVLIAAIALTYVNTTKRLTSNNEFIAKRMGELGERHIPMESDEFKDLSASRRETENYFESKHQRGVAGMSLVAVLFIETGGSPWLLAALAALEVLLDARSDTHAVLRRKYFQ